MKNNFNSNSNNKRRKRNFLFKKQQPAVLHICLVELWNMRKQREKTTDHTSVILESPPPQITSPGHLLQMSRFSSFSPHLKTACALLIASSRHVLFPQCALFFLS